MTCYANSLFLSTTILWYPCMLKLQLFRHGSFRGNNALPCIYGSLLLTPVSLDVSLPAGSIDLFHATASANGFLQKYAFLYPSRNGGREGVGCSYESFIKVKKKITDIHIYTALHFPISVNGVLVFFCNS